MKFTDFINKAPVARDDLFGEWKQSGIVIGEGDADKKIAEKLSWMRIRVKRAIKAKELTIPTNADCKFKRGKVPFAKVGETMAVYTGNDLLLTVVCGGGEFKVVHGKTDAVSSTIACPKKKGKKTAETSYAPTPREIQDATPIELRTGWVNYDLLDKINEECCEASLKYWNEHDGKFPKRKIKD